MAVDIEIRKLEVKKDERGWLAEMLRREEMGSHTRFGQFLITTANPGYVKGNHYHKRKTEWFCVIKGRAEVTFENVKTREKKTIILDEKEPTIVKINPFTNHSVKNIGKEEMYLLAYVDDVYEEKDSDTFRVEKV